MMETIIDDKQVTFKELEEKIYNYVCGIGREITRIILESYDKELSEGRDKGKYRSKGKKKTTIKTVYGEVEYRRNIYQIKTGEGLNAYVFLLDEKMHMDKIGLISTNLAEKTALAVTESPYRVAADTVSPACGQGISAAGVWNMMQRLGERIGKEESHAVEQMEAGRPGGTETTPVLFEEMDGVWLRMQDGHHKKMKMQEMKVSTTYEGWDGDSRNRSRLVNKRVFAGMEGSTEFHKKREALIEKKYNVDEIGQRVLNGDGGSWIKEPYDPDTVFQLDRFHIYKEIRKKLKDKDAQEAVTELFKEGKTEEMLDYIRIYADSVPGGDEGGKKSEDALQLYSYLSNNKEGLLPYQERGIKIPEPEGGTVYKNMGVQENQNCTVITMRMKHRRMRWSVNGANNMAKALYRKENGELIETIERYTDSLAFTAEMKGIIEILSASKAPKKDGKGSSYVDVITHHMPLEEAVRTASSKAMLKAFGF